MKTLV